MVSTAIKVGFALLTLAILGSATRAEAKEIARYDAEVVQVFDGDTVQVNIKSWPAELNPISVRLSGIDTPESTKRLAKCRDERARGLEAKAFAKSLMPVGLVVTVVYTNRDKYGGRIGGLIILPDGRDVSKIMLDTKRALPYSGGTKASWCG